jgi:hypothetical protein
MVYTTRIKIISAVLAIALNWTFPTSAADAVYPLISYKCDADADILTITNTLLKGDAGANYRYSAEEGTYSPWDMVEIARKTDSTRIIKSSKITNSCELSRGVYTTVLEPQIFSEDLDGQCGASISGAVTIAFNETDLLERTAFEDHCQDDAPIIIRITVFGKTGEYKIKRIAKYEFY